MARVENNSVPSELQFTCTHRFRGIHELENDNGKLVLTENQEGSATTTSSPKPTAVLAESYKLVFTQLPEVRSLAIQVPSGQHEAMLNLYGIVRTKH